MSIIEEGKECMIAIFPLYHIAGIVLTMFLGLAYGTTLIFYPSFDFETFLRDNEKYKVSFLQLIQ